MDFYNEICEENTFHTILHGERKRTERSEKPFLLTLINTENVKTAASFPEILKKIERALLKSKRDTDICGWYEFGTKFGVIFTEIDSIDTREAQEAISSKILRNLSEHIPLEIMDTITIDFHFYPEKCEENSEKKNFSNQLSIRT